MLSAGWLHPRRGGPGARTSWQSATPPSRPPTARWPRPWRASSRGRAARSPAARGRHPRPPSKRIARDGPRSDREAAEERQSGATRRRETERHTASLRHTRKCQIWADPSITDNDEAYPPRSVFHPPPTAQPIPQAQLQTSRAANLARCTQYPPTLVTSRGPRFSSQPPTPVDDVNARWRRGNPLQAKNAQKEGVRGSASMS